MNLNPINSRPGPVISRILFLCGIYASALNQGRHLRGLGAVASPKRKKKKRKKKEKKRKKEKKKERKKGTMNNVKLLHIKCCFFPIFQ